MNYRGGENKGGRKRNLNSEWSPEPRGEKGRKRNLNPGRSPEPREGSITQHSNEGRSWKSEGKERPGQTLLNEKRYGEALEFYDQRLLDKPLDADLHVGKGKALLGLGRSQEALSAYEEAIRLAPDLSDAHRGQGGVYEQLAQQRKQRAQECYEKAKQLGIP